MKYLLLCVLTLYTILTYGSTVYYLFVLKSQKIICGAYSFIQYGTFSDEN